MRNLLKTVTLILLAAPLLGAEIKQITPPVGQSQAVLQAPSARGTWKIAADDSLAEVQPQLVADGSLAILQAAPGRYLVRWRAGPLKPWQAATIDLGTTPKPPDPPKPEPGPLPHPISTVFAAVIFETGRQPTDPGAAAILRGKGLQDFFVAQGWIGADKLPTLVRIDPDSKLGNIDADKAAWIGKALDAVKQSALPLPVVVWSGGGDGTYTVEPIRKTEAAQIERFKEIARDGK